MDDNKIFDMEKITKIGDELLETLLFYQTYYGKPTSVPKALIRGTYFTDLPIEPIEFDSFEHAIKIYEKDGFLKLSNKGNGWQYTTRKAERVWLNLTEKGYEKVRGKLTWLDIASLKTTRRAKIWAVVSGIAAAISAIAAIIALLKK